MAAPDATAILSRLTSQSNHDRINALRHLKNNIIGHPQRKEEWTDAGLLPRLVQLATAPLAHDDEYAALVRLHSLQLLSSLADAGNASLAAIYESRVVPSILRSTCLDVANAQVTLAALRVLRDITAVARHASSSPLNISYMADNILAADRLNTLSNVLLQPVPTRLIDAQISIVAYLIQTLCFDEHRKNEIVASGVLDALATRLASIIVARGHVLPGAERIAQAEGLSKWMPKPATAACDMGCILGAIAAVVTDSLYRTYKLIVSPSILAVFPITSGEQGKYSKLPSEPIELPGHKPKRHTGHEPMELLLPKASWHKATSLSSIPPYTDHQATKSVPVFRPGSGARADEHDSEEAETPMFAWLISLVRTCQGPEMLKAASTLTSLFKASLTLPCSESTLSLLVIPALVQLMADLESTAKANESSAALHDTELLDLLEEAPAILARLVTDSVVLQKAAADSGAIDVLCKLLKHTFGTPMPCPKPQPWTRSPVQDDMIAPRPLSDSQHQCVFNHRLNLRANTLRALGSLATFSDEYRKKIMQLKVIPYVIASLGSGDSQLAEEQSKSETQVEDFVLSSPAASQGVDFQSIVIAACYAVRILSRSVTVLRTSLVDHNASKPLSELLRSPSIEIRIAATAAVCNLVTDVSSLRQPLLDAGVMGILCEHAHAHNPELRTNALWALKHLVHMAGVQVKKDCLEQIGPSWLVSLLREDTEDDYLFTARSREDEMDEDIDMNMAEASSLKTTASVPGAGKGVLDIAETRLAEFREGETNTAKKSRLVDLALQEQGLGFMRNLIVCDQADKSSAEDDDQPTDFSEMVDFLLESMGGSEEVFRMLTSKLRTKVVNPYGRRDASRSEARVRPPQSKTIEEVVYILVHMAASKSSHRQMVISQTELLKCLAKLFNNQDSQVRRALCHLINNLTWQDHTSDAATCSLRASELRKLGFLQKLERLRQSDDALDVRESARAAIWQLNQGDQ